MKKLHPCLLTGISVVFAVCSCAKETQLDSLDKWIENGYVTVQATRADNNSKTLLQSDGSVYWSPSDSINVFYGQYSLGKFTSLNDAPTKTTAFRSRDTFAFGTISGAAGYGFWSVNPYSEKNSSDGSSVFLSVPSEQRAVSGTFDPESFPSIAKSDNLELAFYNVCGGLKFKVVNEGITSVTFRGNNGEIIAGGVTVDFDENHIPQIKAYNDSLTQVTLKCPEGLVPGEWYFISMLPAVLSKGFTIDLSDGIKTVSYISDRNTSVKRSVFGVLSDVDEGLEFDYDWKKAAFIHKSLLLVVPNCSYSSFFIETEDELINTARKQTDGHIEVIVMKANGPKPNDDIQSLLTQLNISAVPFELTDFRQMAVGNITPYSTYLSTASLYGTTSGIAIKSYYKGDELNVEASLYFKKADNYKLAIALVKDNSEYEIYLNAGATTSSIKSDCVMLESLSSITGDSVTAVEDNIVLYRSFKTVIDDPEAKKNLRIVAYILRPYGDREAVTTGNYGSYYVDNAISVNAGKEVQLPVAKKINSEIGDFEYGGTIEL